MTKQSRKRRKKRSRTKLTLPRVLALLLIIGFLTAAPHLAPALLPELEQDFPEVQTLCEFLEKSVSDKRLPSQNSQDSAPAAALPGSEALTGDESLTVDFLDVGQGLSVLIEADGHFMLYDGGDRSASSFVVAYLKKKGVECLDYLIASHYDADHINGLVGALHVFETKQIFGPSYTADSKVYRSFVSAASELGKEVTAPQPGNRYSFGNGYFEVLSPLSDSYDDANNYSIAIRLVYGDTSFLLTGDAESESEQEMLAAWPDLKSDVLCVGHHGSPTSSSDAFLDRVSPDYAVISCGADNSYGHPAESVLERLQKRNISIWRTDESGTISVSSDGISLNWSAEKDRASSAPNQADITE